MIHATDWIRVDDGWVNATLIVRVIVGADGNVVAHLIDGSVARIKDQKEASRLLMSINGNPPMDNLIGAYRKD